VGGLICLMCKVLCLRGLSFARPNEHRRCTCDPGPQEVYQARATFGHLLTLLRPPVVAFLFRLNRKSRWSQTQKNYDREPPLTLYVLHKSTPSFMVGSSPGGKLRISALTLWCIESKGQCNFSATTLRAGLRISSPTWREANIGPRTSTGPLSKRTHVSSWRQSFDPLLTPVADQDLPR
jgi:hypothetical protein